MIVLQCDNCKRQEENSLPKEILGNWIYFDGVFQVDDRLERDYKKMIYSGGSLHFCRPECFINYFFKLEIIIQRNYNLIPE